MSVLNQLFNRGLLGAKCKTCLALVISRIKLLQNQRDVQRKLMRKEIAQFLQADQEAIAHIRVEHVIREQSIWAAYEILEMFCELILVRVPILESKRECPSDLREAVASIIYSAPRCSDLPDLMHIRNLFAAKYGKEFIAAATELRPDTFVNRTIVEKLSVSARSADIKLKVLKEIAEEYNVVWDYSATEAELRRNPEDLLNGPKHIAAVARISESDNPSPPDFFKHSPTSTNGHEGVHHSLVPAISITNMSRTLINGDSTGPVDTKGTRPQSSDVLERARAAIAAAERASTAARAAAELANLRMSSFKLEERS